MGYTVALHKRLFMCARFRFTGLEVANWAHPSPNTILLRSWPLASGGGSHQVFTSSSREAEVSLWDLASQDRTHVLWPSEQEPLTYKVRLSNREIKNPNAIIFKAEMATTALVSWPRVGSVFTGDTKGNLRYWNLEHPERSNYLSGPYRKYLLPPSMRSINGSLSITVKLLSIGL